MKELLEEESLVHNTLQNQKVWKTCTFVACYAIAISERGHFHYAIMLDFIPPQHFPAKYSSVGHYGLKCDSYEFLWQLVFFNTLS